MAELLSTTGDQTSKACFLPTMKRSIVFLRRHLPLSFGLAIVLFLAAAALLAPFIAGDPLAMQPADRFLPPSALHLFGTDHLGRDVFARAVFGARISLAVGVCVAIASIGCGLLIGLVAGYFQRLESIIMRLMDGLMSIPSIMIAIALVALSKASIGIVIFAITIPEIPRVVRLTRSIVLSARENLFVEAAIAGGASSLRVLRRHILPITVAPLVVQGTYICASAILIEASLSFLGSGTPPDVPSWGNMIASSRFFIGRAPWTILYPGLLLSALIFAVNLVGDGLRDQLDPRFAKGL